MNIDNIHDALNLLDDDIIEEVDKLRNKGKQSRQKEKKTVWLKTVSIAACLCIVVCAYAFGKLGLDGYKMSSREDIVNEGILDEEYVNDSKETGSSEQKKSNEPSVEVEIVSWEETGFTGTVKDSTDTTMYVVGSTVTVKPNGDVNKEAFPVGSQVIVKLLVQEKSEAVMDSNRTECDSNIIYAKSIMPIDTN